MSRVRTVLFSLLILLSWGFAEELPLDTASKDTAVILQDTIATPQNILADSIAKDTATSDTFQQDSTLKDTVLKDTLPNNVIPTDSFVLDSAKGDSLVQDTTAKDSIPKDTLIKKTPPAYPMVAEVEGTRVDLGTTENGFPIYEINGLTYVDGYLVANKTYLLPSDYIPTDTYKSAKGKNFTCNTCINNVAWKAWKDLEKAAKKAKITLWIQSGYRSYKKQDELFAKYVKRDGKKKADIYSARPGASEHQTSLSFDVNHPGSSFDKTVEAKWLDANAYKFGYIIRFPKGKNDETGYKYESWHIRYVGSELAEKLYNGGDWISMEKFFGITSEYQDRPIQK